MKIMKETEKKQRGFTLIEFMVVIALIGLGLVLVVTQFGQANASNQTQTSIRNISSLISGITGMKDVRNGYAGLTNTVLLQTNGVPENMKVGGALKNIYGGAVTAREGVSASNFEIVMEGVPQTNCTEILSKFLSAQNTSITDLSVVNPGAAAAVAATTLPGTVVTALSGVTACGTGINTMYLRGK